MSKTITKIIGKGLLGVLTFLLVLAVVVELTIAGGVIWLQSPNGQNWARGQVSTLAKESGYDLSFSGFSYAFPHGLEVNDLVVEDTDGIVATLDDVVLRVDFAPLMLRHLAFSVDAGALTLHRLPDQEAAEKPDNGDLALSPIDVPNLYFSNISLKALDIEKLDVKEAVFGTALTTSVSISSEASFENDPDVSVKLSLKAGADNEVWLPDAVRFNGALNLQTLDMQIDRLDFKNDLYNIKAQGHGNLGAGGTLDFSAKGAATDLSPVTGMAGKLDMAARLFGTLKEPAITAKGAIDLAPLKERGLDSIDFEIADENLRAGTDGNITLQSVYKDMPLNLSADFNYEDSIFALKDIEGNAPDLQLSGMVDVDTDTMLAEGGINVATDKLGFYSALAGVDIGGAGQAQIAFISENNIQGAKIKTQLSALRYETYEVERASVNALFPDIRNIWPTQMDVKAANIDADGVHIENFSAAIQNANNDLYKLSIEADGNALQSFSLRGQALLQGLQQNNVLARDINLNLRSQESALTMTGIASLGTLDLTIGTEDFTFSSLPLELPPQMQNIMLNGVLNISGTPALPIIRGDMSLSPFSPVEGTSVNIALQPYYRDQRAGVSFISTGSGIQTLKGEASLPLSLSFVPWAFELDGSAPLTGKVNIAANANDLAPFFLPPGHSMRGDITGQATLRGTIDTPDIGGTVSFRDGEYQYAEYGVQLFDIMMDGELNRDAVQVTSLRATDGNSGILSGSGRVSFQNTRNTTLRLNLKDFQLLDSQKATGTFSADLNLQGRDETYLLDGTIRPGQIDIVIPERFQTSIPELNIVKAETSKTDKSVLEIIEMDINVLADDRIFVRGWGLDAEFGGRLDVTGTLEEPQINGVLSSRRGRYEEFGRRFNLARAQLRFQGSMPPSPYLDIAAVTQLEDIEATVHLTGEFEKPDLSFSSVPDLPSDEIMARILFGRNLNTITPFQAVQLKQTLDRLSGRGGGGFDPLGQLRSVTGLDDIRVDTEGEETSVGVGKYLTDEVYLELEKGQGENSGAAKVQIELTPNITLESEVGQDAQAGAGALWRWNY